MATDPSAPEAHAPEVVPPSAPETLSRTHSEHAATIPHEAASPSQRDTPSLPPLRAGVLIGDYELVRLIATGGMGTIWEARNTKNKLNLPVALKIIKAGEQATESDIQRFLIEARAVASLHSHPHIVKIYELGNYGDQYYFVMQLIRGGSLKERLREYQADQRAAARLMIDVAQAIGHAHRRGILHRDLKPDNVLIDDHGNAFVTDFGLAKRVDPAFTSHTLSIALTAKTSHPATDGGTSDSETQGGTVLGTPSYMPPEQAKGQLKQVSTLSDVYGLGAVLYALLTARPPFIGQGVADILTRVITEPPQPPRQVHRPVDRDLEAICLKCLRKAPKERYESADALARDLERWLRRQPVQARSYFWPERAVMWARREPWQAIIGALTIVLAGLTIFAAAQRQMRQEVETKALLTAAEARADQAEADRLEAEKSWFEESFRKSTRTIDTLVNVVESEVGADLAMQPLRRRLLQLATAHFEDAISQWERDPNRLDELASTHAKLAEFAAKLGDDGRAKAEQAYDKAIQITKRLLEAPTRDHGPDIDQRALEIKLATYYHDFGIHQGDANAFDRARELYSQGLALRQRLCACAAHQDPTCEKCLDAKSAPLRAELGRSHGYLGDVYINQGSYQQADQAYKTSHKVREGLFRKFGTHPDLGDDIKFQLARSFGNLALMARFNGDIPQAIEHQEEAARLLRQLLDKAAKAPEDDEGRRDGALARYLEDDASGARQVGAFLMEDQRPAESIAHFDTARAQYQRLVALKPGRLKNYVGLAGTLLDRAQAQLDTKHADQARGDLEAARGLIEQVAELGKDREYQVVKAQFAMVAGQVFLNEKQTDDAVTALESAREGWQELVSQDGQRGTFDDFSELGEAMAQLGLAQERAKQLDEARSWLRSAIAAQKKAQAMAPKVARTQSRLGRSQTDLARLEAARTSTNKDGEPPGGP